MQAVAESRTPAASPAQHRRDKRWGCGDVGGSVTLEITRERHGRSVTYTVSWGVNKGSGWKNWRKPSFRSEEAAVAFANEKWAACVAWLAKVEPATRWGVTPEQRRAELRAAAHARLAA